MPKADEYLLYCRGIPATVWLVKSSVHLLRVMSSHFIVLLLL
jgi:hypothetical protein